MHPKITKIIAAYISFLLIFEQSGFAQVAANLDIAAHLNVLRGSTIEEAFRPLHLRYLSYDPQENAFRLLLDKGDAKDTTPLLLKNNGKTLLQYFLVGISLPNDSFWVNLRPDSPDSILDPLLGQTDVGKILLEADLQLKKDTARFSSPETPEGKAYWDKLYRKAGELFASENISIPTLTRPWIVPGEIIIRESRDNAYIYKATLKVMLEQDYLKDSRVYSFRDERLKQLNEYSSQLMRELIIPKLVKEVNTAKRYAPLRQVYYSLILAQWFKSKFSGGTGAYPSLIDRKDLTGLSSKEVWSKDTYFREYEKSFKEGEYHLQVPVYTPFGQTIRSYFSGGVAFQGLGCESIGGSGPVAFAPAYTVEMLCNGDPSNPIVELTRYLRDVTLEVDTPEPSPVVSEGSGRHLSGGMLDTVNADEKDMLKRIISMARRFRFRTVYLENKAYSYSMRVQGQYFNGNDDILRLYISREFLADFTLFAEAVNDEKIIDACIKGILTHEFGHLIPEFNRDIQPEKRELMANLLAFEPGQMSAIMWYWLSRHPRYQGYSRTWLKEWAAAYISHDSQDSGVADEALELLIERIAKYERGNRQCLLRIYRQRQEAFNPSAFSGAASAVLLTDDKGNTLVDEGSRAQVPVLGHAKTNAYLQALVACKGVVKSAAKALGSGRQTFYNVMERIPGMPRNGEISSLGYEEKAALRVQRAEEILGGQEKKAGGLPDPQATSLKDLERQAIVAALKAAKENKVEAAKRLGIGRQTLYNKVDRYGILPSEYETSPLLPVPFEGYPLPVPVSGFPALEGLEKEMIVIALQETSGDVSIAAKRLQIGRQTLYNKCEAYHIDIADFRSSPSKPLLPLQFCRILPLGTLEKCAVLLTLLCCRNNKVESAKALGIGRQTLYNKIGGLEGLAPNATVGPRLANTLITEYAGGYLAGAAWIIEKYLAAAQAAGGIHEGLLALRNQYFVDNELRLITGMVKEYTEGMHTYSDERIISEARELRGRLNGKIPDPASISFAVALFSESCRRIVSENKTGAGLVDPQIVSFIGGAPADRQIEAAILLLRNRTIVGMLPSEGKTLAVALGAYLSALSGNKVEVHDWDSLLAVRNAQICGAILARLGLKVGVLVKGKGYEFVARRSKVASAEPYINLRNSVKEADVLLRREDPRKKIFEESDVVYGPFGEMIFLWMNDWLTLRTRRIHSSAMPERIIIDEADTPFLEAANEPLAFFRKLFKVRFERKQIYTAIYKFASGLEENRDYAMNRQEVQLLAQTQVLKTGLLQAIKQALQSSYLNDQSYYYKEFIKDRYLIDLLKAALEAQLVFERDEQYFVMNGRVVMRDENTGEIKPYTRWARGIHTFLEIKENVPIQDESVIEGVMTTSEFYNRVPAFSAVIGTSDTRVHAQLKEFYNADVRSLAPQYPSQKRRDIGPLYFLTQEEKHAYVVKVIEDVHATGRPVLINARSPKEAKAIYRLINPDGRQAPLDHKNDEVRLIDGSNEAVDAWNWARIGQANSITVVAQVANRGVEIKLEESLYEPVQTKMLGEIAGLVVIITHHSISCTTEEQQKGRTARRGADGVTLLVEDIRQNPLLLKYAPERLGEFLRGGPFNPQDPTIALIFDEARFLYAESWLRSYRKANVLFGALAKIQFQLIAWSRQSFSGAEDIERNDALFASFINSLYQIVSRNDIHSFNRIFQNFMVMMERKRQGNVKEPPTSHEINTILYSPVVSIEPKRNGSMPPEARPGAQAAVEEMLFNFDPSGGIVSSAGTEAIPKNGKPGGIDFRSLPITTGTVPLPQVDQNTSRVISTGVNVDLNEEWVQIKNMLEARIIPSGRRVLEYLQSYCQKQNSKDDTAKILNFIADILRLEEGRAETTEPEFREILVALESENAANGLQIALNRIKVPAEQLQSVEP